MRSVTPLFIGLSLLAALPIARCEDAPEFPGPAPEHALLGRFVGVWEVDSECSTGPDSEPMKNSGRMTSRMLGERWVVNEMKIDADGTSVVGVQTIGYDPTKKKYVGTWTDSMMNHLWVYEGTYDRATKTLTLEAEGPNLMAGGELIPYRDSYQFVSGDRIRSRSEAKGDDGKWTTFMTGEMRRQAE